MSDLLRLYGPAEVGKDGYPPEWHATIKHLIREQSGNRCVRCGHPYRSGKHGNGEWSPCDEQCDHRGPWRIPDYYASHTEQRHIGDAFGIEMERGRSEPLVEAQWRILTVHHLDGDKANCRWWNLASLCQRCHLHIQGKVQMMRVYPFEHSDWFKLYAAGWYAHAYLNEDLDREQTEARLHELLELERQA